MESQQVMLQLGHRSSEKLQQSVCTRRENFKYVPPYTYDLIKKIASHPQHSYDIRMLQGWYLCACAT